MRRFLCTLTGVFMLIGLAACVTPAGSGAPAGSASASVTASPTPSPTGAIDWQPIVDAAHLAKNDYPATQTKNEKLTTPFTLPCKASLTASHRAMNGWNYVNAKGDFVAQAVAAYDPQPGSAIVDEIRAGLGGCRKWQSGTDLSMENAGEFTIPRPTGTDNAMAYCYRMTYLTGPVKGDTIVVCEAYLSRGHLVTVVGTYDRNARVSREKTAALVPIGAAALVRALPTL